MTNTSGLAALLAKKKAQADGPEVSESHPNDTQEHDGVGESARQPATIPSEAPTGESKTQRPANPFGRRKDTGSDGASESTGEGLAPGSASDSSDQPVKSKLRDVSVSAGPQSTDSDSSGLASPAITSLDALDESTVEGTAPRQSVGSHFEDETPADKPTRELPEGLTKEQLGFVDLIDGVYEVLHEADLMGGVIRNIIIELKSNPEYMKLVAPQDIRTWVRGMRESMGLAKIKKTESKVKRAGGAGSKSKLIDEDMLQDLNDLGVSIPS